MSLAPETRWPGPDDVLAALPDFSSRVLSASAVVAYVAVGTAQTAMTKTLPFKVIMV